MYCRLTAIFELSVCQEFNLNRDCVTYLSCIPTLLTTWQRACGVRAAQKATVDRRRRVVGSSFKESLPARVEAKGMYRSMKISLSVADPILPRIQTLFTHLITLRFGYRSHHSHLISSPYQHAFSIVSYQGHQTFVVPQKLPKPSHFSSLASIFFKSPTPALAASIATSRFMISIARSTPASP